MKFNIDIESYRSRFLGGNARAYLFFVQIQFPGFGNVLKSGIGGALASGSVDGSLYKGTMSAGSAAIDLIGLEKNTDDFGYYVKSTNLPESTIQETSTYWCGQEYKIASTQRFPEWTVTFYVDNRADILKKFFDWHKIIHNPQTNAYGKPGTYMSDQLLYLIGLDGSSEISTYKLFGAWPKQIGQVSLDYASNEFAQFDVTFAYQYHTVTEKEVGTIAAITKRAAEGALQSIL
jgi:hypothetical protein